MGIKKTTKNVEPKNPEARATETDTDRTADRKTATARWGGRKSARKTAGMKWNG